MEGGYGRHEGNMVVIGSEYGCHRRRLYMAPIRVGGALGPVGPINIHRVVGANMELDRTCATIWALRCLFANLLMWLVCDLVLLCGTLV